MMRNVLQRLLLACPKLANTLMELLSVKADYIFAGPGVKCKSVFFKQWKTA